MAYPVKGPMPKKPALKAKKPPSLQQSLAEKMTSGAFAR